MSHHQADFSFQPSENPIMWWVGIQADRTLLLHSGLTNPSHIQPQTLPCALLGVQHNMGGQAACNTEFRLSSLMISD